MEIFKHVFLEIREQESIILTSQSFAAVPSPKLVVGEVLSIALDQSNSKNKEIEKSRKMVFPGQKKSKISEMNFSDGKETKSFRLPKCLESFQSCVEDMEGMPEGRELG